MEQQTTRFNAPNFSNTHQSASLMPAPDNGEDDLEAFFEEVDHVVEAEEETEGDPGPIPMEPSPPPRPRGVMVAAAAPQRSVEAPPISTTVPSSSFTTAPLPVVVVGPTLPPVPVLPSYLPPASVDGLPPAGTKRPHVRQAAGKVWVDPTLADWPDDDFRIFVGNLDPTVTDALLHQHFAKYASLQQVRVIRDLKKKAQPSLGYGFCSLGDPLECAQALREMDQSWLGGRPIRIKRSHWKDRELQERNQKKKKKRF
jgi:RNA recognition motif. (a.k.a. RRM, RBD, or RNP domain)